MKFIKKTRSKLDETWLMYIWSLVKDYQTYIYIWILFAFVNLVRARLLLIPILGVLITFLMFLSTKSELRDKVKKPIKLHKHKDYKNSSS